MTMPFTLVCEDAVDAMGELQPLARADRRAADLQHVFAAQLGQLARLGNALEHLRHA